jgi:GNAT superfamily N-acetyltransferase
MTTTSNSMDSNLALNHSLARAETIHRERQLLALQTLYPGQGYTIKHIAGSTTILSPPEFGRKINHTYGFALSGEVLPDDLRDIEAVYEQNGVRPDFDMCEFADSTGFDLLSEHYTITGLLCEYQQSLHDSQYLATLGSSIDIAILGPEDHDTFVQASVDGFLSGGRSVELLKALAESAAARSDTILFSASIDGELVGTAAMAMIETVDNKTVVLFIDSCLPSARGKGVHKALLLERLRVARAQGFDTASATAREGSISAKNMEKVGFRKGYSSKIYTKDH